MRATWRSVCRQVPALAIPLPAGSSAQDATVGCVLMSWPVINPLSRYRHAKRAAAGANPPEWPKSIIPRQGGEKVETPPTVWFQGRGDVLHDYKDADASFPGNEPQRFVANYRKAGGEIALEYIDAEPLRAAIIVIGRAEDLSKTGDVANLGEIRRVPCVSTCSSAWSSSSIATLRCRGGFETRPRKGPVPPGDLKRRFCFIPTWVLCR